MISKILKYIKEKLSLESVNKSLLFLALASLFIRSGNFNNTLIPKPFEIIFSVLIFLTVIDVVKNKKIREFYESIPRNIWLAVFGLEISILIGWSMTIFIKNIPINNEMILEFSRMLIAVSTFLLIFFYTRNDKMLIKKYFYALLSPVVYIVFLFVPNLPDNSPVTIAGRFVGFTNNVNTVSKLMLVPAIFFIVYALFESKNKLLKIVYIIASAGIVALLIWSSSRGSLLALITGSLFVFFYFIAKNFSRTMIFGGLFTILIIFTSGFLVTPYSGKQIILNRILNRDTTQTHYYQLKGESINDIIQKSINKNDNVSVGEKKEKFPETRLEIWPAYLKMALQNPLGVGPAFNTHMKVYISKYGNFFGSGSHNSYIEVLLWGGVMGLVSFVYILFIAFRNLVVKLKTDFNVEIVALIASLFVLSVAIMFDDSSKLYLFLAMMALSILWRKLDKEF